MSTKKRLKKITAADICVIAKTHQRSLTCKLISWMTDEPLVKQKLWCYKCDVKLSEMYAKAINSGSFYSTFEHFKDIALENSLNSVNYSMDCEHNDEIRKREFGQKIEDFQEYLSKKNYDVKPETDIERLAYLRSQKFMVYEVNNGNKKYIVRIPAGRDFVTDEEMAVITQLGSRLELPPDSGAERCFTVFENGDDII